MTPKKTSGKEIRRLLMDSFFPDRYNCICCNRELWSEHRLGTCPDCLSRLSFVRYPYCLKCGKPIQAPTPDPLEPEVAEEDRFGVYCSLCKKEPRHFDRVLSALAYQGEATRLVHKIKYASAAYLAPYMAAYMVDRYLQDPIEVDYVTAVPLHKSRQRARGYNQSALIATAFSQKLHIPYVQSVLKCKKTPPQTRLGREERKLNLKGAFTADRDQVRGKRILVIDDVLTTGQTMDEVAHTLKKAGAVHVYGLTFASVVETATPPQSPLPHGLRGFLARLKKGFRKQ